MYLAIMAAVLSAAASTVGPTGAAAPAGFDSVAPLSATTLGATRAGQGEVYAAVSEQNLTALNSGNSVNANVVDSGGVNLQSGAFSGFSGLGNFVINTGNNNNLQGSLNVTILMVPAALK